MNKNTSIDILTVVHFLLWLTVGYIFPNKYKIIILLAILWELFEYMIVKVDVLYNLTKKYWFVPEKYWNESIYNKIIDMIFNILGYSLGCYIFYYSNKK
jgi:hypothetical protein